MLSPRLGAYAQMCGSRLAGQRILVVEGARGLRAEILRTLREEGACARGVANGEAAVRLVLAGASFDVLVVERNLPGMDGMECAHLLRFMGRAVQCGRIGAIVGFGGDGGLPDETGDGFDESIGKPFSGAELVEVVERLAPRKSPRPGPP